VAIPPGVSWFTWRPVHAHLASRTEVCTSLSIDEVQDMHEILDAFEDAEAEARRRADRKAF
jgi:hypothetical protein